MPESWEPGACWACVTFSTIRTRFALEFAGRRWKGVAELFDEALVYGTAPFCDHSSEYNVPLPLRYCGWVVEPPVPARREPIT